MNTVTLEIPFKVEQKKTFSLWEIIDKYSEYLQNKENDMIDIELVKKSMENEEKGISLADFDKKYV